MATRADQRGWGPGWPNCQADKFVKVVLSNGVRVIARREIAELVKLLLEEGIRRGYPPRDGQTWGAACRAIAGTGTPSNHSWALAFDINSLANPQRRPLTTDMPRWYIDLWKRYGFRWGGDYVNATPDSMHFEYMGTPASAAEDTARARRELASSDHVPVPVPEEDPDMAFTDHHALLLEQLHQFLLEQVDPDDGQKHNTAVENFRRLKNLQAVADRDIDTLRPLIAEVLEAVKADDSPSSGGPGGVTADALADELAARLAS